MCKNAIHILWRRIFFWCVWRCFHFRNITSYELFFSFDGRPLSRLHSDRNWDSLFLQIFLCFYLQFLIALDCLINTCRNLLSTGECSRVRLVFSCDVHLRVETLKQSTVNCFLVKLCLVKLMRPALCHSKPGKHKRLSTWWLSHLQELEGVIVGSDVWAVSAAASVFFCDHGLELPRTPPI